MSPRSRFVKFGVCVGLFLGWCACVCAHPSAALHANDVKYTFKGYNFESLSLDFSKIIDTMEVDGVRLSASNHRDLYHGILLGEAIPQDQLTSLVNTYVKQNNVSPEVAKARLIEDRKTYDNTVTQLFMNETGLPKKQAHAFAGIHHDIHLLGDLEPIDNALIKSLPEPERIARNLIKHIETLFKGGDEEVLKWVAYMKGQIEELIQIYKGRPGELMLQLKRLLVKEDFGKMLFKRWGNTLKGKGIYYIEEIVKKLYRESDRALAEADRIRKRKLAENPKRQKTSGLKDERYNRKHARVSKEVREKVLQQQEMTCQGTWQQRIRMKTGEIVDVLTVRVAKGAVAGVKAGVLTFVFTEGSTYAMYQLGALSAEEFEEQTIKNCGASLAAGMTTAVLVTLGATPTGWVILLTSSVVDITYGLVYDELKWINSFSWEHDWIFGEVPTEIQRRRKLFAPPEGRRGIFDFPKRVTPLNFMASPEIRGRSTPLDFNNNPEIRERSSPFDFGNNPEIQRRRSPF